MPPGKHRYLPENHHRSSGESAAAQSYVSAVEQRMGDIPQCEVPLRLFRYGIRYLISKDPAELVELVKPEREILYQALNLSENSA